MTKRLATICLMAILAIKAGSPSLHAEIAGRRATLKDISTVYVLIESLPNAANGLGLTEDGIQTDVELKLRLAGIRVVTESEVSKVPGGPVVYVRLTMTDDAEAAFVELQLWQDVSLERTGQLAFSMITWVSGTVVSHPTSQGIRSVTKDLTDKFLNDWLSVNPKK